MPAQQGKTTLSFAAAARAHVKDETDFGTDFSALPAPINNGRARLASVSIGTYKKGDNQGKKFVRFAASVEFPIVCHAERWAYKTGPQYGPKGRAVMETVVPEVVKGKQTSVMYCLGDDKRGTLEENVARIINEFKRTSGDPKFCDPLEKAQTDEQFFQILEALVRKLRDLRPAPVVKFTSRFGELTAERPNPMVFEDWYGKTDDLGQLLSLSAGVAPAAAPAMPNGHAVGPAPAGLADNTGGQPFDETKNDQLVGTGGGESGGGDEADDLPADDDWDGWVARWESLDGDNPDEAGAKDEAFEHLVGLAGAAGVGREQVEAQDGWAQVKELMDAGAGGDEDAGAGDADEEQPAEPQKGEVWYATLPKDPAKPMKGKAKTPVLIETVNKQARTVTGKNNTTKAKVVDKAGKAVAIPFDDLTQD